MEFNRIIKWIWVVLIISLLSLLIMLAIGQIQLYLLTSVDSHDHIKVGFPFWYYSFSRDGNNFHGGNAMNLIIDYSLTWLIVAIGYFVMKKNRKS
jgi:hypothetical protein